TASRTGFQRWIGFFEDDGLGGKAVPQLRDQRVEPASPRYGAARDNAFQLIRTFRVVSVPIISAAIWNRSILSASRCWRYSRLCWRLFFSTFSVSGFGHESQMRR